MLTLSWLVHVSRAVRQGVREIDKAGCGKTAARYKAIHKQDKPRTAAKDVANHRQDKAQDAWANLASIGRVIKGHSTETLFEQLHSTQTFLAKSLIAYHTMT